MRRLAVVATLACSLLGIGLAIRPAFAGSGQPLNNGCQLVSVNPSVASSASDADCVFQVGTWYRFQCDVSVYYTTTGVDPTTASYKVTFPGEGEPFVVKGATSVQPLKVLAVAGTATCNVFLTDP